MLDGSVMQFRHCLPLFLITCGCGNSAAGGSAALSIVVEPEATITNGIAAGTGDDDMQDGWQATFDTYIAAIGNVDLQLATDPEITATDKGVYAVDLKTAPAGGLELWKLEDLSEGRYEFSYRLSSASRTQRDESVSASDFSRMVEEDLTYLIKGKIMKENGVSCPPRAFSAVQNRAAVGQSDAGDDCYANATITFDIGVNAETTYGPCEIDGLSGVVLSSDKTQTATITLHGDHLFFNGFPEGGEGGVTRTAQWLADADLNVDGVVTKEELFALAPADLPALAGVQLGGTPLSPLDSLWTYVTAQLKTQGHYQGEGECAVDGAE